MTNLVALYGTMKHYYSNDGAVTMAEGTHLSTEKLYGFVMYDMEDYPAVQPSDDDSFILVEVYEVEHMEPLDYINDCTAYDDSTDVLFTRSLVPTSMGDAWLYLFKGAVGDRPVIEGGEWNPGLQPKDMESGNEHNQ